MKQLIGIGIMVGMAVTGLAEQEPSEFARPLLIRVYDYSGLPRQTMRSAEERTTAIFHRAGIELEWAHCRISVDDPKPGDPACKQPMGPEDIMLRILTEKMARQVGRQEDCVGYSIHTSTGRGDKAGIFFHRIQQVERESKAPRSAVLGIFMAHEIGHLLLPDGRHSRDGVMRGWWEPQVMLRAAYGKVDFSVRQSKQMQKNVARRRAASFSAMASATPASAPRSAGRVADTRRR
jgi:hypothetical protein